jgi:hypothetical protein
LGIKKKKKKGSDGDSYTDYSDSENGSEIGDSGTTPPAPSVAAGS